MTRLPDTVPADRAVRQRDLVPPERLAACHGLVIGVGAIGHQVALQLAALGMPRLTLFDDDHVAVENLAAQGYAADDLGQAKVEATAALCHRLNPDAQFIPVPQRFKRSTVRALPAHRPLIVFLCVDSIQGRRLLWEALRGQADFLVDGRMSAEVVRVLAVAAPATDNSYVTTLFAAEEAYVGSCTARSTIYAASIAAGLMVGQFARWLRGLPVEADLLLNLLAAELTVAPAS